MEKQLNEKLTRIKKQTHHVFLIHLPFPRAKTVSNRPGTTWPRVSFLAGWTWPASTVADVRVQLFRYLILCQSGRVLNGINGCLENWAIGAPSAQLDKFLEQCSDGEQQRDMTYLHLLLVNVKLLAKPPEWRTKQVSRQRHLTFFFTSLFKVRPTPTTRDLVDQTFIVFQHTTTTTTTTMLPRHHHQQTKRLITTTDSGLTTTNSQKRGPRDVSTSLGP